MAVGGFDQTLAPSRKKAPLKGLVLEQCSSGFPWLKLSEVDRVDALCGLVYFTLALHCASC